MPFASHNLGLSAVEDLLPSCSRYPSLLLPWRRTVREACPICSDDTVQVFIVIFMWALRDPFDNRRSTIFCERQRKGGDGQKEQESYWLYPKLFEGSQWRFQAHWRHSQVMKTLLKGFACDVCLAVRRGLAACLWPMVKIIECVRLPWQSVLSQFGW